MEDSDGLRYFSWDYSGLKLLTERDEQGEVTALYSHGYSAVPGIGSVATAQKFESDTTYYQFPQMDHRGSVYRLTNDDGDVVFSAEYNAFGEVLDESNTGATNRLGYQSNWLTLKDSGNELVLSPARVYSAKLGRFLQKDFLLQMTLLRQQGSYWNSIFYGKQRNLFNLDSYGLYRAFNSSPYNYKDIFGNIELFGVEGKPLDILENSSERYINFETPKIITRFLGSTIYGRADAEATIDRLKTQIKDGCCCIEDVKFKFSVMIYVPETWPRSKGTQYSYGEVIDHKGGNNWVPNQLYYQAVLHEKGHAKSYRDFAEMTLVKIAEKSRKCFPNNGKKWTQKECQKYAENYIQQRVNKVNFLIGPKGKIGALWHDYVGRTPVRGEKKKDITEAHFDKNGNLISDTYEEFREKILIPEVNKYLNDDHFELGK